MINVEILYVMYVCMSGDIILEDQKVGRYGPDINQGHWFFCLSRKTPIKEISVKVTLIAVDIQSIEDVASSAWIQIQLVS